MVTVESTIAGAESLIILVVFVTKVTAESRHHPPRQNQSTRQTLRPRPPSHPTQA